MSEHNLTITAKHYRELLERIRALEETIMRMGLALKPPPETVKND